jgi:hypothetical protein
MVRPIASWSATLLLAAVLGCGGSTRENVVTPSAAGRCQMSLAVPPSLPAAGAQVTGELSAARDCTWTAQTTSTWLRIDPTSGQGQATLTLTASDNPQGRSRSATVDINQQLFTVTQEGLPCHFAVAPSSISIGHQGGRAAVQLSTLEGCSWTTQSSQPWLRVVTGSGGEASATIELAIDSNTEAERSALLTIATLLVAVSQQAGPNDRTECRFSLDPGAHTIPAAGGSGSFSLSTLPGCAWSAVSNQSWITIVSSANVIGSSNVQYRVEPNLSTSTRSGAIAAGTRRHVVQQEGSPRP